MQTKQNYGIFGQEFKKFKFLPKISYFFRGDSQNSAHFGPVLGGGQPAPKDTYALRIYTRASVQNYVHRLSIPENQPVTSEEGVPVGQIPAARDDDGDEENRHACYRIEQNNDGKYAPFFLKATDSRVLMTNESLDREAQSSYRLRIRTFDCAQECTSTSLSVGKNNYGARSRSTISASDFSTDHHCGQDAA
jgi:hypothetical protein